jgi:enoyl-CoA hydratase/carnithine racemase
MITYRQVGPVAYAMLDRPDKLNAMTRGFWGEMVALLARLEADPEVRVVIVHGAGRCFSVGGDIEGFGELTHAGDRRAYLKEAIGALELFDRFPKPTIAAVHGHALGGGCELTIVCDIVVADATARFGTPEAMVGLVPGPGVARGLAHVNLHWMKYMIFTGESLDAEQARLAGLVNVVAPEGEHLSTAEGLATRIAARAPLALEVGKALLGAQAPAAWSHAIDGVGYLQGTDDFREGIAAFEARRAPQFEGR